MLLVGLTGGIASGKTLVSNAFAELGVTVIDADVLAREAVSPGSNGLQQLVEHFGTDILSDDELYKDKLTEHKQLNRAALRTLIFNNPAHRETVDRILHPIIRQLSDAAICKATETGHRYAIYAIPLLIETKQQDRFDRIAVVDVPRSLQIERLVKRDGGDRTAAEKILAVQASREERLAVADDVIDNSGSIEDTLKRVNELHERYLALSVDN